MTKPPTITLLRLNYVTKSLVYSEIGFFCMGLNHNDVSYGICYCHIFDSH